MYTRTNHTNTHITQTTHIHMQATMHTPNTRAHKYHTCTHRSCAHTHTRTHTSQVHMSTANDMHKHNTRKYIMCMYTYTGQVQTYRTYAHTHIHSSHTYHIVRTHRHTTHMRAHIHMYCAHTPTPTCIYHTCTHTPPEAKGLCKSGGREGRAPVHPHTCLTWGMLKATHGL